MVMYSPSCPRDRAISHTRTRFRSRQDQLHDFKINYTRRGGSRLSDTMIRRHWERARKVNINGEVVSLDPAGPLAEAAWAKQRISRATQALPNGFCGL